MPRRTQTKFIVLPDRGSQGAFYRPASGQSAFDALSFQSGVFYPRRQRFGLSVKSQQSVTPFVSLLLFLRNPTDVAGKIAKRSVNTVQCFTLRAHAHISKEVAKVSPLAVNGDTATSVQMPADIVRVCAAFNHRTPRVPCGCLTHHMATVQRTDGVTPQASARPSCALTQRAVSYSNSIAAITTAKPLRRPSFITSLPANYKKAAEAFTSDVYWSSHNRSVSDG